MHNDEKRFDSWHDAGINTGAKRSGNVKTACPKCDQEKKRPHDTPFSANLDEGYGHCHRCGYVVVLNGDQYVRRGSREQKRYVKPELPKRETRRLGPKAREFFTSRGIDPDIAAEMGVYSNPADDALAFPYTKFGEDVLCKYRAFPVKRFWSTAESEPVFYGFDQVGDSDTVVIVEGELEYLSLLTVGIDKVMSLPNGAVQPGAASDGKLACMESALPIFERARRVVIATDADAPGEATAQELIRRIGPAKCWRVMFPEGCNDPNDILRTHGAAALIESIEFARPAPVEGIFTGYDIESDLIRLWENGPDRGLGFGYDVFDQCYSVLPGYMTIVTGIANHGKSLALDQLLMRLSMRHDWRFAVFSPEQMPLEWHQQTLIKQYTGLPFYAGVTQRIEKEHLIEANRWIADRFSFLYPGEPTVDAILELAKIEVYRRGINGIVIDPWNELDFSRRGNLTETENVSLTLGKIRRFARDLKVHVWVVAHPTKLPKDASGVDFVPTLDHASGSNNFKNKADFGLTVWRNMQAMDGRMDIIVTKTRRRDIAVFGSRVEFQLNPMNDRLAEIGRVTGATAV